MNIYESITFDLDKITDEYMRRVNAATDELMDEKLASIGYVKVVRCRDCKHFRSHGDDYLFCNLAGRELDGGDGFCAWGERK